MNASNLFRFVAQRLRDNGHEAQASFDRQGQPLILIEGKGQYRIVAQADRAYFWEGENSGKMSDGFTCDLYLSDGEEIAESLVDLLDEE